MRLVLRASSNRLDQYPRPVRDKERVTFSSKKMSLCQEVCSQAEKTKKTAEKTYYRKIRLDFGLCDRLFDHGDEPFREVGHGDDGFELGGDPFGIVLGFPEGFAQGVDLDFSEDFFEGAFSVE